MTDTDVTMDESDAAAERAAKRIAFHLTYARTAEPREFGIGLMDGPDIPCAYGSDTKASGEWDDPDDGIARTEEQWIDRFARYPINEAVHEALEYYRVDGKTWLNPHGPAECEIFAAVNRLHEELADIRRRHRTAAVQQAGVK